MGTDQRADEATGDHAESMSPGASRSEGWDEAAVRRLRGFLGDTQAAFADRLGTRQQTVSEWETGASHPRRMARRLLEIVAEERGFYAVDSAASGVPETARATIESAGAGATGEPSEGPPKSPPHSPPGTQ